MQERYMRLEPAQRPDNVLRVSARLITSSTILHLSSDELERALALEQIENPALEVNEQHVCLFCGTPVQGQTCANCGHFAQHSPPAFSTNDSSPGEEIPAEVQWDNYYH